MTGVAGGLDRSHAGPLHRSGRLPKRVGPCGLKLSGAQSRRKPTQAVAGRNVALCPSARPQPRHLVLEQQRYKHSEDSGRSAAETEGAYALHVPTISVEFCGGGACPGRKIGVLLGGPYQEKD